MSSWGVRRGPGSILDGHYPAAPVGGSASGAQRVHPVRSLHGTVGGRQTRHIPYSAYGIHPGRVAARRPLRPAPACLRRQLPPLRCATGCPVRVRPWISRDAGAAPAHEDRHGGRVVAQQHRQVQVEIWHRSLAVEGRQLAELDLDSRGTTVTARRSRAGSLWDPRSLCLLGFHALTPIALGGDSSDTWSGARPAFGRAIVERGGRITAPCLRYLTAAARRSRCRKACCAAALTQGSLALLYAAASPLRRLHAIRARRRHLLAQSALQLPEELAPIHEPR